MKLLKATTAYAENDERKRVMNDWENMRGQEMGLSGSRYRIDNFQKEERKKKTNYK